MCASGDSPQLATYPHSDAMTGSGSCVYIRRALCPFYSSLLAMVTCCDAMTDSEFQYPDGATYSGQIRNTDGLPHGLGKKVLADGSQYKGSFVNGLFEGPGVMELADRSRYEGQFLNGEFHGFGVFTHSQGIIFRGEFHSGNISKGQVTFADGTHGLKCQEGDFQNGSLITQKNCPKIVECANTESEEAKALAASL